MKILLLTLIFILGSVFGSFLNVCIYRIPRNISIVFPSSFCPTCKKNIPFYYNIPIIGYIILKGKCKFCNEKISIRYPFIEGLTGCLALLCYLNWDLNLAILHFLFLSSLIVITFIDIDFQIIPDVISLPAILISFFLSIFVLNRSFISTILAILIGGGIFFIIGKIYELVAKKEGLGGGDVKLMAYFGGYLGLKSIFFIIFVSSLFGTIYGLSLMILHGKKSSQAIPFGPFLSLGAFLYLFFGDRMILWYLSKM
jgi:leader peptidase (prepilin peptidase)/N-methyltransferase